MDECNHDCAHCEENCNEKVDPKDLLLKINEKSHVKKVIGILSGKGGVGKSLVSSLLACALAKEGFKVGVLDADITGPSIPKTFGVTQKAYGEGELIYPAQTKVLGIDIISSNMLLEHDDDPVIWRGSLISNLVGQFYKDVYWGEKDFLLIDMPPGTGDVALTTFQSIPLDGIVIVTTPQDLVSLIVKKAVNMANLMNIKVLGVVENMSYVLCPKCGEKIYPYGKSTTEEKLKTENIKLLSELPIDPKLTEAVDSGKIELYENDYLKNVVDELIK